MRCDESEEGVVGEVWVRLGEGSLAARHCVVLVGLFGMGMRSPTDLSAEQTPNHEKSEFALNTQTPRNPRI
jgi:hypothetical protein